MQKGAWRKLWSSRRRPRRILNPMSTTPRIPSRPDDLRMPEHLRTLPRVHPGRQAWSNRGISLGLKSTRQRANHAARIALKPDFAEPTAIAAYAPRSFAMSMRWRTSSAQCADPTRDGAEHPRAVLPSTAAAAAGRRSSGSGSTGICVPIAKSAAAWSASDRARPDNPCTMTGFGDTLHSPLRAWSPRSATFFSSTEETPRWPAWPSRIGDRKGRTASGFRFTPLLRSRAPSARHPNDPADFPTCTRTPIGPELARATGPSRVRIGLAGREQVCA